MIHIRVFDVFVRCCHPSFVVARMRVFDVFVRFCHPSFNDVCVVARACCSPCLAKCLVLTVGVWDVPRVFRTLCIPCVCLLSGHTASLLFQAGSHAHSPDGSPYRLLGTDSVPPFLVWSAGQGPRKA